MRDLKNIESDAKASSDSTNLKLDMLPSMLLKEIDSYAGVQPEEKHATSALVLTNHRTFSLLQKTSRLSFSRQRILMSLLPNVVNREQDTAHEMLTVLTESMKQWLLRNRGTVTDYQGRTFYCTAYEYAYWSKDTHMRRMLEQHMDEVTKAQLLARCEAIENDGLSYVQHGEVKCSKHFDLNPLILALRSYCEGNDDWVKEKNLTAIKAALMQVGIALRDVPVHVVNEYCRSDRSFQPTPNFNEENLPQNSRYFDYNTMKSQSMYPLIFSDEAGLGVNFTLIRGWAMGGAAGGGSWGMSGLRGGPVAFDLAAIIRLDEVRTTDLVLSRVDLAHDVLLRYK